MWHHRPVDPQRFPILFTGLNKTMGVIGMGPGTCYVELDADVLTVRMGVGFRARVARNAVRSAALDLDPVRAWGVHGWRGRWLVNGASVNIVRLDLDPPVRAHVLGFPVALRQLRLSMVDPEGLIEALGAI